ncbi:MAG: hypothetical protein HOW97_32480 [Catenulispora sp.]|nr:hypothetical protein [Catenulispora sp.]
MNTQLRIRRHGVWLGVGAAVVLGVGTTALAAGTGTFDSSAHSPYMAYTARCQAPAPIGTQVRVTVSDMGGMMGGGSMMGGRSMMGAGPMMGSGGSGYGFGRMGMTVSPQTVPAGTVTLDVMNTGMRDHEVLVLPLAAGQAIGQRTVGADDRIDESTSLGEVSATCAAGAGDGLKPGAVGWTTLNLAPGRYELVCNIAGHYGAGAFAELDVT